MRIAVAGFQHETNTFSTQKTVLEDFEQADVWPKLCEGREILNLLSGMNIPMSGFIEQAAHEHVQVVPILWCSAPPSGLVNKDAFEMISQKIITGIIESQPDAIYLDLHGAMVAEHQDDPDGSLIKQMRQQLDSTIPIIVSLDYHANVSKDMFEYSNLLLSYKTYPHIDMADTGKLACQILVHNIAGLSYKAFKLLPFQIPLPWQCSTIEPMSTIFTNIEKLQNKYDAIISFCPAFPLSDVDYLGPTICSYGAKESDVNEIIKIVEHDIIQAKPDFNGKLWSATEAIDYSLSRPGPIIFADTQDNSGGGASSDVVEIIKIFAERKLKSTVVAMVCDPISMEVVANHYEGDNIELTLGGRTSTPNQSPLCGTFKIISIRLGQFIGTGPYYKGCQIDLGPMACLDYQGVEVIVSSRKMQAADRSIFHYMGIDPSERHILCLKSSVHFRADFTALSSEILVVLSPGSNIADPKQLNYQKYQTEAN
ncbi:MAG: M81 family metallopeptidase [Francisellaceae bacterium]|jgi:microcystin degradation protein MlrC|nr:M81 family metallopeptidase [Francisellaceae bacterium]MBT6207107.1 M81 family metallopeptidase [Francisellaceae bacterium]MBT6538988.1 M81 family metallopeptidase [Francisellaceae bacterium]